MNDLLIYLFQASCCLGALYFFYVFLLGRETFFRINRFFLLFAPVISLIIPLVPIHFTTTASPEIFQAMIDPVWITSGQIITTDNRFSSLIGILPYLFLTGFVFFVLRYFIRLIHILILINRGKLHQIGKVNVMLLPGECAPFSFLNLIFIPETEVDKKSLNTILLHELVHIRQGHSIDLLLMEFIAAVMWFNPFVWLVRRELKSIHEFLADQGVLRVGISKTEYQQLIFSESTGLAFNAIVNTFNYSHLKKRMVMMTKHVSSPWAMGKVALALPVIAGAICFFAIVNNGSAAAQDQNKKVKKTETPAATSSTATQQVPPSSSTPSPPPPPPAPADQSQTKMSKPDVMPKYPGDQKALQNFLIENIKYPEKAKRDTVQGKVYIKFDVGADGSLSNFKVQKGIGSGCDEEALRVVKMMPKWIPATKEGKPVKSNVVIPIMFALR